MEQPEIDRDVRNLREAQAGDVVDRRYALRREIARGGVAFVFEAEHLRTGARVAVKTLRRRGLDDRSAHERLLRESRILGALRHPMIVAAYDAGVCPVLGPYLVLELIEGRPLDGILVSRTTIPVAQAVALTAQLARALESVHDAGYVHRDVKPSNVLISRTPIGDQVELIDFGIARAIGERGVDEADKLTRTGELLGTVEYMASEQLLGSPVVDGRADVYACGVLLYEALAGEVPFAGPATAVIAQVMSRARPAPIRTRRPDVPESLAAVIERALEHDPARRFQSARELAAALDEACGPGQRLDLLAQRDDRVARAQESESKPTVTEEPARRRQFVRAPYVAPVRVVLAPGRARDGRTEDISEGGLLIVTDEQCERDQPVVVRLPLPTSGRVVQVEGTTRWVRAGRSQRAIGIEFVRLAEDVRSEIRKYVGLMSRDGAQR